MTDSYLGNLPLEERVQKMQELEAQEKDFEASQRMRREAAGIEGQRQEMERHVTERGKRYLENTGAVPTQTQVAAWRDEHADQREAEHQADNRRRYDEAAARDSIF